MSETEDCVQVTLSSEVAPDETVTLSDDDLPQLPVAPELRDARGHYLPGNRGNPAHIVNNQDRRRYYAALSSRVSMDDWLAIIDQAVDDAINGPITARKAARDWLSKYLLHKKAPVTAFVDIDHAKIGRTRRGRPIIAPDDLLDWWRRYDRPAVLAAVGSRGARESIRDRLNHMGFREGVDWWAVA